MSTFTACVVVVLFTSMCVALAVRIDKSPK